MTDQQVSILFLCLLLAGCIPIPVPRRGEQQTPASPIDQPNRNVSWSTSAEPRRESGGVLALAVVDRRPAVQTGRWSPNVLAEGVTYPSPLAALWISELRDQLGEPQASIAVVTLPTMADAEVLTLLRRTGAPRFLIIELRRMELTVGWRLYAAVQVDALLLDPNGTIIQRISLERDRWEQHVAEPTDGASRVARGVTEEILRRLQP